MFYVKHKMNQICFALLCLALRDPLKAELIFLSLLINLFFRSQGVSVYTARMIYNACEAISFKQSPRTSRDVCSEGKKAWLCMVMSCTPAALFQQDATIHSDWGNA